MNIPLVRVFTANAITSLTAEFLYSGIEKRLALMTFLFCPKEELPPEQVLEQLRIETTASGELKLRWKPGMQFPPRAYRFRTELAEQKQMAEFALDSYPAEAVVEFRQVIDSAADGAGFFQGYDRDDMGWPVVMSVAATLVEQAGGLIVTNGYGWFVPTGNEVKCVLEA